MKGAYCSWLFIAQLTCHCLYGQYYLSASNQAEPDIIWQLGTAAGAMNCITDIGGSATKKILPGINWNQTQWGAGFFASASWRYLFALRLQGNWAHIAGSDQVLTDASGPARNRYLRNLQFKTSIAELAALAELYPLMIINKDRPLNRISPYLATGAGVFKYNPQARWHNSWVSLRPLHTEGEGFKEYPGNHPYSAFSWCLPLGAGIRYDAGNLVNVGFECLYRFTGTDYLDDVSKQYIDPSLFSQYLSAAQSILAAQLADRSTELPVGTRHLPNDMRGNPANRDAYFSCVLSAAVVLNRLPRKIVYH